MSQADMSKMELLIFPLKSTLPPPSSSQIATSSSQSLMPKPLGFCGGFFLAWLLSFNLSHLIQQEILLT